MKYTSEIFQRLSRGQFISSNSIDADTRAIYNDIEENQQEYEDYFGKIDFQLSCGDGFYYFSRKEAKVIIENKLQALFSWISRFGSCLSGPLPDASDSAVESSVHLPS